MKARAIVMIDYTIDGGYKEAADLQEKLEQLIADYANQQGDTVVAHQIDMRERRGDKTPDLKQMKFRAY